MRERKAALEELRTLRQFWLNEKKYLTFAFYPGIYLVVVLIAKYTSYFEDGLVPENIFHLALAVTLIFYRLMALAVAPAVLTVWLIKKLQKQN